MLAVGLDGRRRFLDLLLADLELHELFLLQLDFLPLVGRLLIFHLDPLKRLVLLC